MNKELVGLFLTENSGLTHGAIEKCLGSRMTRSTIYRTLQTFVNRDIVYKGKMQRMYSSGAQLRSLFLRTGFM